MLHAGAATAAAQSPEPPSIRQQLEETGGFERIIVSADEPMPLAQLAARAKLVVEATVTAGQSYVDESGNDVYTDYTIAIGSVIKSRERDVMKLADAITVRRQHGVVVLNGRAATVSENGFPAFQIGGRYILFLTRGPRDYVYSVLGGGQGAFTADDIVAPAAAIDGAAAPRAASRADFMGEVHALLKFSEY
jgi:hypothetical protein